MKIKTFIHLVMGFACSLVVAHAEITNDIMRILQERAAEKIEIEFQKATQRWQVGGWRHKVEAKVTGVTASASGLKMGDEIMIHYRISNAPGSYPCTVERGKRYEAYLRLDPEKKSKTYEDVAEGKRIYRAYA